MAFLFQTFSKIAAACEIMIDNANSALHHLFPSKIDFCVPIPWKGFLSALFKAIFKDHLVNDLSTKDASPPEKFLTDTVEFFEDHDSTATMALHRKPPFFEW
jgi:hypothetical protein